MKQSLSKLSIAGATALSLIAAPVSAVTFDELAQLEAGSYQVIDCRSSTQYNGWPEQELRTGGHFPSAVNLAADWLPLLDDEALQKQLTLRQLDPQLPTYLYCGSGATVVKERLSRMGFKQLDEIEQPLSGYSGKLNSLPNYQQLVSAPWLKALLDGKHPVHAPDGDYRVVEVAWGPPTGYLAAHIPGALYLNTNELETEERQWNRVDDRELQQVLEQLGIRYDTAVILYGRETMAAARAANLFMYAGVEDVRLLDGGWQSWERADFSTEALVNRARPVAFGKTVPVRPELVIDVPQARQLLADRAGSSLVSIRSWPEYIGETSGYSYIGHKGRIKGSRWGQAGSDAYHLERFRNPDGTMLSPGLITRRWREWGILSDQQVAFYCGTGWRASEVFFYAHVMGWDNISVFDGGWYEWSNDPANPVETGELVRK